MAQSLNTGAIPATRYYTHTSYVPTYYYIYIALEKWIAGNIFKNDLSRVFMASNDYAFRRRFELTDMSKAYDEIEASALQFPFANYNSLNQGWQKDEREAANTAAQVYAGLYVGTTKLNTAAVTATIPVQFYFDREDDARLAYDRLFFFGFNVHYYKSNVSYADNTLEIPYAFALEDLNFNPSFNETDWLKQNRIFVITVNFKISTYTIYPPDQLSYDATESDIANYDDGIERYSITEDVVLDFWTKNLKMEVQNFIGTDQFPIEGKPGIVYVDTLCKEADEGTAANHKFRSCNIYLWKYDEALQKYAYKQVNVERLVDINLDSIGVNGALTPAPARIKQLVVSNLTSNSATVNWAYDDNYDRAQISKITIAVNNPRDEQVIEGNSIYYTLTKLKAQSNYIVYLKFYSLDGTVKSLYITFTTKEAPVKADKTLPKNALIGLSWDLD